MMLTWTFQFLIDEMNVIDFVRLEGFQGFYQQAYLPRVFECYYGVKERRTGLILRINGHTVNIFFRHGIGVQTGDFI